ncbi:MAG: pyridoxamine 5'-phosphate oxidase family protein [Actinomycetota bacterium]|nr:MAG: pyridoxamine 5'-phosphate oxidase family protein [Actinomycetota bacterium]
MDETAAERAELQRLLDRSMAAAGPHLRDIITDERRLTADEVCERLQGMVLLTMATVTSDGRPIGAPIDGYFLHGRFHVSTGPDSVRLRHLQSRPAVTATHLPGEQLAVTVHGRAELYDGTDPAWVRLRQAMLDHYVPTQGPQFAEWLDSIAPVAAVIVPDKMFTFAMD